MSAATRSTAPRITHPRMTDEEVAETLDAIAETYRPRDPADPSIALVDGFGVRVRVESGHLEVSDGIGPHRRTRRYSRAERSLRRLVIVGDGVMTTQALRWCQAIGVSVVLVDDDGIVFAESPATSDDVRVRRAQAAAGMPGSPVGVEIVSRLLDAKLAGQVTNLRSLLGRADHAETVDELRAGLGQALHQLLTLHLGLLEPEHA